VASQGFAHGQQARFLGRLSLGEARGVAEVFAHESPRRVAVGEKVVRLIEELEAHSSSSSPRVLPPMRVTPMGCAFLPH
jgi:hypothetical protein